MSAEKKEKKEKESQEIIKREISGVEKGPIRIEESYEQSGAERRTTDKKKKEEK
ncbi:MAG: hypothetical protein OEX77_09170 [Candidatus Bathyarchaeota archaeon]|nr:hypothetical protein [Candidatus Bathyarchaeota archaeon]